MATIPQARQDVDNLGELLQRLGNIAPERILLAGPLGAATEEDLLEFVERKGRICELVDGVIVQKAMGFYESRLAAVLVYFLEAFLEENDLGIVLGEAGMIRLEQQVREPDVAFFAWSRFPNRLLPPGQILDTAADLAVEVLSPGNTKEEMDRKYREYFLAGTRIVWEVSPPTRSVKVFTDPVTFIVKGENDTLQGGEVLPGFTLAVRKWFDRAGGREK
jgi:Uma2 family endonuclease